MLLGKHPFFFLLLGLIITPFAISKIVWFATTDKAMGKVAGIGHESGMSLGISSYSLVEFSMGNKIFSFHGGEENLKEGDMVAIRYPRTNPEDAKLDTWLTTLESLAFMYVLLILWGVLYIMPDLFPHNAKIMVGKKPFLKIIKAAKF